MDDDTWEDTWEEPPPAPLSNEMQIASAGTLNVPEISDEDAILAGQKILDTAPEKLRDSFEHCCAYYVYRHLLVEATKKNDIGQMYAAQSSLLSMIDD